MIDIDSFETHKRALDQTLSNNPIFILSLDLFVRTIKQSELGSATIEIESINGSIQIPEGTKRIFSYLWTELFKNKACQKPVWKIAFLDTSDNSC